MTKRAHKATCTMSYADEEGQGPRCGAPCSCWCTDGKHENCVCADCNAEFWGEDEPD